LTFNDKIQLKNSFFKVSKNKFDANLELVFWDTGSILVPEISINIMNLDSAAIYSINSDSFFVNIVSVKEKNLTLNSGSNGILPIKGPVEIQNNENLSLILKIILLVAISFGIVSLWKKRIKKEFSTEASLSYQKPFEVALKKLELMKKSDISNKELKKDFYVKISFIIREYIETSFFIRSLEMTTEEIRNNSEILPFDRSLAMELVSILSLADLVKYAKDDKDAGQCLKSLESSIEFVKKSSVKLLAIDD